jgi:uncharacterized protein
MRRVFADTYYWIALLNDKDQGHTAAQAVSQSLGQTTIVTTQEVLSQVLTHFSGYGRLMRQSAVSFIRNILADSAIQQDFRAGYVVPLPFRQMQLDRLALAADCDVDFRAETTTGPSRCLGVLPPSAPAAWWGARAIIESSNRLDNCASNRFVAG